MRLIDKGTLDMILEKHKKWLQNEEGGERANLYNANLRNADLRGAGNVPFIPMACPDSGSFTAWKKANGYVVKLLVPEDARRSSSTGRKCRCDKAVVIAIETTDGKPSGLNEIASDYKSDFIYRVGETVTVPNFCKDRFRECAEGIHFLSTVKRQLIIKNECKKEAQAACRQHLRNMQILWHTRRDIKMLLRLSERGNNQYT